MSKKIVKRIGFIVSVIALVFIIAGACAIIWYQGNISPIISVKCDNSDECKPQSFIVDKGASAADIATKLEKAGLIKNALAFRIYLAIQADNKNLLPGEYLFSKNMSVADIVKSLNDGIVPKTVRITFLPGETLRASRQHLIDAGYEESAIDAAFSKKYDPELLRSRPEGATLEGYIWGDTYEFYESDSVETILNKIFDEMLKDLKEHDVINKLSERGMTLHEGITLASVIQREAPANYEEKRHISQVFQTRLKRGIVLGSDAIIAYAADQINPYRDKSDMSYLTTIGCPWNSRRCQGLPPSPIATPNIESVLSVTEPTDTDDIYFITGDDGNMYYAKTEAEHNANVRKYCQKLCQIL